MDDDEVNAGGLRGMAVFEDDDGGGIVEMRRTGVLVMDGVIDLLSCFAVPGFCGDLKVSVEVVEGTALSLLLLAIASLLISSLLVSVVEVSVHDTTSNVSSPFCLSLQSN